MWLSPLRYFIISILPTDRKLPARSSYRYTDSTDQELACRSQDKQGDRRLSLMPRPCRTDAYSDSTGWIGCSMLTVNLVAADLCVMLQMKSERESSHGGACEHVMLVHGPEWCHGALPDIRGRIATRTESQNLSISEVVAW